MVIQGYQRSRISPPGSLSALHNVCTERNSFISSLGAVVVNLAFGDSTLCHSVINTLMGKLNLFFFFLNEPFLFLLQDCL